MKSLAPRLAAATPVKVVVSPSCRSSTAPFGPSATGQNVGTALKAEANLNVIHTGLEVADLVGIAANDEHVRAGPADQHVIPPKAREPVVPRPALEPVVAVPAPQLIVATATGEPGRAVASEHHVVMGGADRTPDRMQGVLAFTRRVAVTELAEVDRDPCFA